VRLLLPFLLFAAAPAAAQGSSDSGDVAIAANVAGLCVLGPPTISSVELGVIVATTGPRTGRIAAPGPRAVTFPGSFCNFAGAAVSIEAEAMVGDPGGTLPSGFARAVNFTSTVDNWAASPAVVTTFAGADGSARAASGVGPSHPEPKIADIVLTVSDFTVPSDAILISGLYAGRVTITLGPAVGGETPGD
jgi:hypothetical protein